LSSKRIYKYTHYNIYIIVVVYVPVNLCIYKKLVFAHNSIHSVFDLNYIGFRLTHHRGKKT
jgi:hypothetical protein